MDLGRIGLPPRQCECRVVPLDYRPMRIGSLRGFFRGLFCKSKADYYRGAGNRSQVLVRPSAYSTCDPASQFLATARNLLRLSIPLLRKLRLLTNAIQLWSGCRESNPDLTLPKRVYYHYTTPRSDYDSIFSGFI